MSPLPSYPSLNPGGDGQFPEQVGDSVQPRDPPRDPQLLLETAVTDPVAGSWRLLQVKMASNTCVE